jgi:hypothetical protein
MEFYGVKFASLLAERVFEHGRCVSLFSKSCVRTFFVPANIRGVNANGMQ